MPGYTSPEDEADKLRRMDLTRVQRGTVGSRRQRLLKALRNQSPTGPPMQMAHTQHFDDPVGYVNKFLTERLSKAKREATILRIKEGVRWEALKGGFRVGRDFPREKLSYTPGSLPTKFGQTLGKVVGNFSPFQRDRERREDFRNWNKAVLNRRPGQTPEDAGRGPSAVIATKARRYNK